MVETDQAPDVDYGPLTGLLGEWRGDKGMDVAPEPDGAEENPYYETITYEGVGVVTNAESQDLTAVRYNQVVSRKSDAKVFHDEAGYWIWDPKTDIVMHSLTIPRAVCVLAGGRWSTTDKETGDVTLEVEAALGDSDWGIVQSPFMRDNARTIRFQHRLTVGNTKLSYIETTVVDIYGKSFEHTDQNELVRS